MARCETLSAAMRIRGRVFLLALLLGATSAVLGTEAPGRRAIPLGTTERWRVIAGVGLIFLEAILIAGLLFQRARQRHAQRLLSEHLRFERLLSELSARLIPATLSDVNAEIERGLHRVVEVLRMDRATLQEYAPGGALVPISRVGAGAERLSRTTATDQFPWTASRLQRGHVVRFSRLDGLPAEGRIDRQSYLDMGTRSCLSLPLSAGGSLLACCRLTQSMARKPGRMSW